MTATLQPSTDTALTMRRLRAFRIVVVAAGCLAWLQPSHAADGGRLAGVAWLHKQLGRTDVVLLDAPPPYAARRVQRRQR